MGALVRTFRCPLCGCDEFDEDELRGSIVSFHVKFHCPRCLTFHGVAMWLEEIEE